MARLNKKRCADTGDLFGFTPPPPAFPKAKPKLVLPTAEALQAERLRGQGPFTEWLDNPWALRIRVMKDGVAAWLAGLLAKYPKTYAPWLQIESPKGLSAPAKRMWLLVHLMALSDALLVLGEAPDDAERQAKVREKALQCRAGFLRIRQGLAANEALHWEWVYAALYWWPNSFRFMAQHPDWQDLAQKKPEEWMLDPTGHWPARAAKPHPKLPPRYPRWVYTLHLEHYGPKILTLAGKPPKWPASPMQATYHQGTEPLFRPKAQKAANPHQLGLKLDLSPHP